MSAFVIVAALLTAAALLCVLPPLLRRDRIGAPRAHRDQGNLAVLRDQARELDADLAAGTISAESYRDARAELERRVAQDLPLPERTSEAPRQALTALALVLAVPALAAGLYFKVGNPAGVSVFPAAAQTQQQEGHRSTDTEIAKMVQTLAERLQREPGDIEGWQMLARSYSVLGRFEDASQVYARLEQLLPQDPGVLADYADALATTQGASLKGQPERLIERALALDPRHVKALALSGSAAFERGDFVRAEQQWQAVLTLLPSDSEFARSTGASIAAARARLAGEGASAQALEDPAARPGTLTGTVGLMPALRAGLAGTDSVFIYAHAVGGPGFPLAVLRRQVKDLPLRFTLDDSMGMVAGTHLSAYPQVIVGARISRSGSATPASGDLEGIAGPVAANARGIAIEINTRRK